MFNQAILLYLLLLLLVFVLATGAMLVEKWKNDWRHRYWAGRKASFHESVRGYLTSEADVPPRFYAAGDFRAWCLNELIALKEKFSGTAERKLTELVRDWGFADEAASWMRTRAWWKQLKGLHVTALFELTEYRERVVALLDSRNAAVRHKALHTLTIIGERSDLAFIINMLNREKPEWYRLERTVGLLERIGEREGQELEANEEYQALHAFFVRAENPFLRRCLAELMGRKGLYDALPMLIDAFPDEEPEVKIGILKTLIALHASGTRDFLLSTLNEDPNPGVQIISMKAIAMLGGPSMRSAYIRYLSHPNWWVRYYSAVGLARMGETGKQELERLMVQHPDGYGREMARYFHQLMKGGALWQSIERSLAIG